MILAVLPTPEQVKAVRKAAARGIGARTISEKVFGSWAKLQLVQDIIANPTAFSYDVDEVAVARALKGDETVWENLTHLERRTVVLLALERRRVELRENAEWSEFYTKGRNGATHSDRRAGDKPLPHDQFKPAWAEGMVKASGHRDFRAFMEKARKVEKRMLEAM